MNIYYDQYFLLYLIFIIYIYIVYYKSVIIFNSLKFIEFAMLILSKEQSFNLLLDFIFRYYIYISQFLVLHVIVIFSWSWFRKNFSFQRDSLKISIPFTVYFPCDTVDGLELQVPFIVARCHSFAAHVLPFVSQINRTRLLRWEIKKKNLLSSFFDLISSEENFKLIPTSYLILFFDSILPYTVFNPRFNKFIQK